MAYDAPTVLAPSAHACANEHVSGPLNEENEDSAYEMMY